MKSHARWEGGGANIEVQSWQWRRGGKGARRGERLRRGGDKVARKRKEVRGEEGVVQEEPV